MKPLEPGPIVLMSIDEVQFLWDGSEPGWALFHSSKTVYRLVFDFDSSGPTKEEIVRLHQVVPELKFEKLPSVYRELKGAVRYVTEQEFGSIDAHQLEVLAQKANLR